ncbi:MAG TPA: hybrid sensor histidine kinase/response regulator [Cytophagaceae bacterium]|jgi:signal transduction histidine kinase|nr:hybrid sensor histidine kinase/response regulator [Cytophagaceae bacterium]
MEKINILYLDDEINNLQSFKAKFRVDYTIFLANNISEAYQILNNNPQIQIIISDQRMPNMSGVEFFESILTTHPDPIRILLTGYSDINAVIDAINKGQIYRYLEKPWNDHEMKFAIENAFRFYFINHQLKSKNAELQKTNEELNRFAYSASHDLKAPVKSMLGILKLAQKENKSDDELLLLLGESVKKLDYFINNIIDYYKNTRSEKTLNEIDFNKIIRDALETIDQTISSTRNININISIVQDKPFVNDEFRIYVIISYLLSNAVKYQKKEEQHKEISISVQVNEKLARIKIHDNGIGIPQKHKDNIYKMFYRATTQSTGSGIGLYIVKETLEKLEGKIKMSSTENEGTEFELEIPNEIVREAIAK